MTTKVTRDKFFWTLALQTACVNFFLGGFGPAQTLLRQDQKTSLAIAGLHGTALGIASIAAGLANPHLAHRFGRARTGWFGLLTFTFGLVMFVSVPPVQLTLIAALITGFGTSIVINNFVTSMNGHFHKMAPLAISEANAIASVGFVTGTLLVGTIANSYRSAWRLGILAAVPLILFLYFVMREKNPQTHVPDGSGPQSGSLSLKFWIAWFGFVACISSEFATTFWAAALVKDRTSSTAAISTIAIMALGIGMAVGRWYATKVLRRWHVDIQLKIVIATQLIGFIILWLSHTLTISLVALLTVGIGISVQFSLSSLRLIGLSSGRPDLAIGRSSLGAGFAIGGAPFALGLLGDHLGISRAYIMVPVLIVIAYLIVQFIPAHVSQSE